MLHFVKPRYLAPMPLSLDLYVEPEPIDEGEEVHDFARAAGVTLPDEESES